MPQNRMNPVNGLWFRRFGVYVGTLALGLGLWAIAHVAPPPTPGNAQAGTRFSEAELRWLAHPQGIAPDSFRHTGLFWMRAYRQGRMLAHRWSSADVAREWPQFVTQPAEQFELGQALFNQATAAGGKRLDEEGLWGFEFRHLPVPIRAAPQDLVRTRLTPPELIKRVRLTHDGRVQGCFRARVALVSGGEGVEIMRSSPYVPRELLNRAVVEQFCNRLGRGLVRLVQLNHGWTPYRVTLPRGEFSKEGMLIVRPCLAAWALARWSRTHPEDRAVAETNLQSLLRDYGRLDGDRFFIESGQDRPLGALALTGLALRYLPDSREAALARSLVAMHNPAGWFHTQYSPRMPANAPAPDPRLDRNQLFYPPEAMLYLAERYAASKEPSWKGHFDQAFEWYRRQFWRDPQPPLVPWFVQACARMEEVTHAPIYADEALRMQDWHLQNLQAWEQMNPPDLRGGAINPRVRAYGAIGHSSSCGVHLEGLIQAYRLAGRRGQRQRQERYRRAMMESLGYLIQCQYRDERDLYWISPARRPYFEGSIRSNPADGVIQIDNDAHALNAVLTILAEVPESEFHIP